MLTVQSLVMLIALLGQQLVKAAESDPVRAAKEALAEVDSQIAKERTKWSDALGVINQLTNNKRTPVKEGSDAYYKCVDASKIVTAVEKAAPGLKAQKEKLETLVKTLEASQLARGVPRPRDTKPTTATPTEKTERGSPGEPPPPAQGPSRMWTDSKGRQIKASFVKLEGTKVILQNDAGQNQSLLLSDLSLEDQAFVKKPIESPTSKPRPGNEDATFKQLATKYNALEVDWFSSNTAFEKNKFYKLGPHMATAIGNNILGTLDSDHTAYVLAPPQGESFPAIRTMSISSGPPILNMEGQVLEFTAIGVYTGEVMARRTTVPMFTCVYLQVDGKEVYRVSGSK